MFAVIALLSLAACSAGPSESDMNEAMKKQIDMANKQLASIGNAGGSFGKSMAESMKMEAPKLKKIGCKGDGDNAYRCDVEVITKDGAQATNVRFVKGSEGWAASK